MKIKEFNLGVYGTNCYLAYDNKNKGYFFDAGGKDLEKVKRFVQENGIEIKYLIQTHGHYDHIGGMNRFHEIFPEAEVLINEVETIFLKDNRYSLSHMIEGIDFIYTGPYKTFKDGDVIGEFQVIGTPGHTGGSTCFYSSEGKFLISGDTMFRRSFGRTDLLTSDTGEIFRSLKKLCDTLPLETKVYSAHTEVTTIGEEKQFLISQGYIE